jgi:hypothetical protein
MIGVRENDRLCTPIAAMSLPALVAFQGDIAEKGIKIS